MSYVVYAVENADRMILMGPPVADQPTFKTITLSYIQAPRLARRMATGGFTPEEPYAYEAAELIRSTFIGKQVQFAEDYYIEALQRSAGRIMGANHQEATAMLLKEGLATLPDRMPPRMEKELYEIYSQMSAAARAARKGLFSSDSAKHVRHMKSYTPEELAEKIETIHGQVLQSRIEKVVSPTLLIISVKELGDTQFAAHLTGVTAKENDSETINAEAKFFIERLLQNRNVKVRYDGVDGFNNVMVSIMSPKGSFQEELLAKGYVKVQNATLSLSSRIDEITSAETNAKKQRVGCWKNYVEPVVVVAPAAEGEEGGAPGEEEGAAAPGDGADGTTTAAAAAAAPAPKVVGLPTTLPDGTPGPAYTGPLEFVGKLVQVVHGDTVVIQDDASLQLLRVSLAGVRSSKNIDRDQDGNSPETRVTYNDYSWEAKEFLRSRYIGCKVVVTVEYARVMPETKEIRPAATVLVKDTGINIGVALLEAGYATFFLGRNDKCSKASELSAAEDGAKEEKKGVHRDTPAPPMKVLELNHLGETRSRYYLSFLQRGMQGSRPPPLKGVVDLVLGPSSLRVYIPKENFQIPVKVAGIMTPSTAFNPNEKADPFAQEAKDFVIGIAQQRNVTIQVFTSDRAGNFICCVALDDGTNLSVALVTEGLATVANADRLPFAQQLIDAESAAREAQKFIWSPKGAIPQRAVKLEKERAAANPHAMSRVLDETSKFAPYMVTEVADDGLAVYLQGYDAEQDSKKGHIQDLINRTVAGAEYTPKKGERVIAQYSGDKTWCRAAVLKAPRDGKAEVQFIDFGNTETVPVKHIRAVPRGPEYAAVRDTPAFAKLARLAFLKPGGSGDVFSGVAYAEVEEYAEGEVLAKAVYRDGAGSLYYTVTTSESAPSLSETLLQRGLALLDRRTAVVGAAEYRRHEEAQEIARKGRKNLWQYGDIDEGDADD
ncbi:Staphylococcal nuclease-like protein [Novymonas esmeraldas]|uniref:Staphylococcal nuclease-like protein n=1 Tax=Novymonas esmeraldas TaxID=1808958 RepID=A0AAW0F358_9TRYP